MFDESFSYGAVSAGVLGGLVLVTLYFQNSTVDRASEYIAGLHERVRSTVLAEAAMNRVMRRHKRFPLLQLGAAFPAYVLSLFVAVGCFVSFSNIDFKSPLFGGPIFDHAAESGAVFEPRVVAVAFITCYIWMMWEFLVRVNTHDLTPIVYYGFAVRMLSVIILSGLIQFLAPLGFDLGAAKGTGDFGTADAVALGAAVLGGRNPRLWLDQLTFWVAERFRRNVGGLRPMDPKQTDMPEHLPLTVIGGLTDGKLDRLSELGIDNVQQLGSENPVTIWVLTRYNLALVVHWAAQAQLARHLNSSQLKTLEGQGINDVFEYMAAIECPNARKIIADKLSIEDYVVQSHRAAMLRDADYNNLLELRNSLWLAGHRLPAMGEDAAMREQFAINGYIGAPSGAAARTRTDGQAMIGFNAVALCHQCPLASDVPSLSDGAREDS